MQIESINTKVEPILKSSNESISEIIKEQEKLEKNIDQKELQEAKTIPKDKIIERHQIVDALEKMSKTIELFNKRLKFAIDEESKRIVVKVIDTETNKIVREIPPEEVLRFVAKLHKFLGIFIDKKR